MGSSGPLAVTENRYLQLVCQKLHVEMLHQYPLVQLMMVRNVISRRQSHPVK